MSLTAPTLAIGKAHITTVPPFIVICVSPSSVLDLKKQGSFKPELKSYDYTYE
jgi:hypothetical protein